MSSTDPMAVAHRFLDALNAGDADALTAIYAEDARIWHNFDRQYQSVSDNARSLKWMHRKLNNLSYDVKRLEPIEGGYLQQHVLRGTLASGEDFALDALAIVQVENGRIVSLEEYLDLAQAAPLQA